jgi:hypothetical protein
MNGLKVPCQITLMFFVSPGLSHGVRRPTNPPVGVADASICNREAYLARLLASNRHQSPKVVAFHHVRYYCFDG